MDKIINVKGYNYILASSVMAEERIRVLKHEETFAVFDRYGDIYNVGAGEEGLYHEGTRFLSHLELKLGQFRPLLLSSTVRDDNAVLTIDLTNPDIEDNGQCIPSGSLHLLRTIFIWYGRCYERLNITNFSDKGCNLPVIYKFAADFADIFEVRGQKRHKRGNLAEAKWLSDRAEISYVGLDDVERRLTVVTSVTTVDHSGQDLRFAAELPARSAWDVTLIYECELDVRTNKKDAGSPAAQFDNSLTASAESLQKGRNSYCEIVTSNQQFNDWLSRSISDLDMLMSRTPGGLYPYAGVPWFSTTFGRDGMITALQLGWVRPEIARGVLAFLAQTQAQNAAPERDAEPGKILHEARRGEMAALSEIPFGKYYGSIDSTPLFVMLAGNYYDQTGDLGFIESIWSHIELALRWIDEFGDQDGDGFVEYGRRSKDGLLNQGWKDSNDSVFHEDGSDASGPLALCEVQGYVYQAKIKAAELALALGKETESRRLNLQAEDLKLHFNESYWCEDLKTFALALDGQKLPCRVRTSNAGHCLYTGIASTANGRHAAATLMGEDSFSGWGIRTLAARQKRYNPMSYHNGSVWPHDNAVIAAGMAKYGRKDLAQRLLSGLFDASVFLDLHRLPELFCGFRRRSGEGPTLYPLSCAPQAWAAGAVFMLLKACLGLSIHGAARTLTFYYPSLPPELACITIRKLSVGSDFTVDLEINRYENDVEIRVLKRSGPVEVAIIK